jgi:hypothetical protein
MSTMTIIILLSIAVIGSIIYYIKKENELDSEYNRLSDSFDYIPAVLKVKRSTDNVEKTTDISSKEVTDNEHISDTTAFVLNSFSNFSYSSRSSNYSEDSSDNINQRFQHFHKDIN